MGERYVPAAELFPLLEEQLAQGKTAKFTVTGTSMMPWIISRRDSVELVSAKGLTLKKGDIVLFCPFPGKYVLHRITKLVPGGFITAGDGNLHRDGVVPVSSVVAKTVTIFRKNRVIDCSSLRWKMISWLWMVLFPVRRQMFSLVGWVSRMKRMGQRANFLR